MELNLAPPDRHGDLAMHKYLVLEGEHDALLRRLDQYQPAPAGEQPPSSTDTTPSSSPTRHQPSGRHHRRGARRLEVVPEEPQTGQGCTGDEEQRLWVVNEGIKRTLTELLNCDAIKADDSLRMWVQRRLMDAERELRVGRRRRCAGGGF